jgi:predicted SAM-dependent methyltransferase
LLKFIALGEDFMGNKLPYLNIGCGTKYNEEWVNIDMYSPSTDVLKCNILKGISFPDESFEIVYHSQVLEHIPKEKVFDFVNECYRVLKHDGIIRIVVPDLENIAREYIKVLQQNISNPTRISDANYDWIMLEMYDQTVRNYSGGMMAKYLQQKYIKNEDYIFGRTGHAGRSIREDYLSGSDKSVRNKLTRDMKLLGLYGLGKKILAYINHKIMIFILGEKYRIGDFRLGGEVHMWMYDRYSLTRLLKNAGFKDIEVKNPFESNIPRWEIYELDVRDGLVYDPTSLFIEAKK